MVVLTMGPTAGEVPPCLLLERPLQSCLREPLLGQLGSVRAVYPAGEDGRLHERLCLVLTELRSEKALHLVLGILEVPEQFERRVVYYAVVRLLLIVVLGPLPQQPACSGLRVRLRGRVQGQVQVRVRVEVGFLRG